MEVDRRGVLKIGTRDGQNLADFSQWPIDADCAGEICFIRALQYGVFVGCFGSRGAALAVRRRAGYMTE